MRTAIFVVILSAAGAAVGQSVPSPFGPIELGKSPAPCGQLSHNFCKLPWGEPVTALKVPRVFHIQEVGSPHRLNDAQIDPMIVAHPPQSSLGVQPEGKLVAKNEFPNLQLLPIEAAKPAPHAIPKQWPNLNLKNIPSTWPKFEMLPVQAGAQPTAGK